MNDLRCLRAIDRRDINLVKEIISKGHDFNAGVGQRKMPPVLYYAVQNNWTEVVQLLINTNCDLNVKYSPELKTPLYVSAMNGNQIMTTLLCRNGANVNEMTTKGRTPLFAAIESSAITKDISLVNLLLNFGADVNVVDINGCSPLILAIKCNYLETIKLLIEMDAKLDINYFIEFKNCLQLNNIKIIEYILMLYKTRATEIDSQITKNTKTSLVDLCLEYNNLKAMKLSIKIGFKISNKLIVNQSILVKTFVSKSDENLEEANYCLDYLLSFIQLNDLRQTFTFKYKPVTNNYIITGNLLTYALLFNCSYASKRLIQLGTPFESQVFNYYRFNCCDVQSLKLLYMCGIRFPSNFSNKCYPNNKFDDQNEKQLNRIEFQEFCKWITTKSCKPYRLSQLIRISLRNTFGIHLSQILNNINFPKQIINYLQFEYI